MNGYYTPLLKVENDSDDNNSDYNHSDDNNSDDVPLLLPLRRSNPLGWPLQLLREEKQVD
jgi:hypothetical protein